ncbi:hypothetical protein D3C72_2084170 [compost metagenome]
MALERDVAGGGLDQAGVGDQPGRGAGVAQHVHLIAARGGRLVRVGAHAPANHKAVAGGQRGLAVRRDDGAPVVRLAAGQQHIAAALGHALRRARGDAGTRFHHYVARGIAE